ncbi:hypothetical protein ACSSZE_00600 [Acidithiobacillus caldus]
MFEHTPSQGDLSFTLLLRALRGITLWQPILVYILAATVGFTIWEALSQWSNAKFPVLVGALFFLASIGVGYLGAGKVLIFEARGEKLPGIFASLGFGLRVLPRLFGLLLVEALLLFGIFLVETLAFALCTLPGVGPYLFIGIFPAAVVVDAVVFVLAIIVFNLSGPALWHGETVAKSLRHTLGIAHSKPGSVLLMMLLLTVLSLGLGLIVSVVLYTGYSMAMSSALPLLASVLRDPGDWAMQLFNILLGNGDLLGHLAAGTDAASSSLFALGQGLGLVVATALIFILPNVVFLLGMAHIYIEALELTAPEDV